MKKYLPLILLGAGLLVVLIAFVVIRGRSKEKPVVEDDEIALLNVPVSERPVVSLTPTEDGHYLKLKVEKIMIDGAETMDYLLVYNTSEGIDQGVPGVTEVKGLNSFEAELLMGSESSGKFRYDEGVEKGSIELKFRNEDGKLLVKFMSDFHLQSGTMEPSSLDGKFTYTLADETDEYFVTMQTVGYPKDPGGSNIYGPYGVFSSTSEKNPGKVAFDMNVGYFRYDGGNLDDVKNTPSSDVGIFVAVGE